eukprot:TRINITY_DN4425_c0_g1_i4.p1 TRINITY_DN4425_c0_g1~~TRINITY_DN4425_c0_g1_i4.p1  ORF type:complete len:456 (+),score=119.19 TRINITY_DN4425_c0_g1_i4:74-1441(+)
MAVIQGDWDWVEIENAFFQQGKEYSLESGWFSEEEAKEKFLQYGEKALGFTMSPHGHVTIVPVGTAKYDCEGWKVFVWKKVLPPADECWEDGFAETDGAVPDEDGVEWMRPGRGDGLGDEMQTLSLFGTVSPDDLDQGAIGDCWLISAFAAMAEFPEALMGLFQQSSLADDGHYVLSLYSYEEKRMVQIEIDDRLPCSRSSCAYVGITDEGEIWPCLLEKAFAKYSGGYEKLDGGWSVFAFGAMTGCTDLTLMQKQGDDWLVMKPTWSTNFVRDCNWGGVQETQTDDGLLPLLAKYDEQNYLMCCGSHAGSDTDKNDGGIVQGHAYSLLQVKLDVAGSGVDLVQLRNPWGSGEWTGDWSDKSPLWEENPEVAEALAFEQAEDGAFWMTWEDFTENYKSIYVCAKNMGVNRGKKTALADHDKFEEDDGQEAKPHRVHKKTRRKRRGFFAQIFGCGC